MPWSSLTTVDILLLLQRSQGFVVLKGMLTESVHKQSAGLLVIHRSFLTDACDCREEAARHRSELTAHTLNTDAVIA